jgi:hypothetical protein
MLRAYPGGHGRLVVVVRRRTWSDMGLGARHLVWRADQTLRRAARRRRRRLARELAAYATPRDRADLLAAVDRCPSPAADEIRRLLERAPVRGERQATPFHLRG